MHKTIKIFSLTLIILLADLLQVRAEDSKTDKIKIGISVPLTGPASSYGTDVKNGLLFANEKIAKNKYELIIEDDQCSDKEAVNIAHKLVNLDQVKYVLGFGCSGTVLSSAPVYERAKVLVIACGTGAPLITQAGDYIFRTKPTLDIAGQKLAEDMQSKFKKVAILTEQTAYCQGLTAGLLKANQDSALELVNEDFLPQTSDFKVLEHAYF